MRAHKVLFLLAAAGVAVAGFAGCGSDDPDRDNDDNSGGGGRDAVSSSTSTSSATSSSAVVSSGSGSSNPGSLAETCEADDDCGADFKCLKPIDTVPAFGGGPAHGYCSKECKEDGDCPGQGSACLSGSCLLGCAYGEPALMFLDDPLDEEKCHGREDLRCQELQNGPAVCIPTCGSADDCDGRECDPLLTVCVDTATQGKPTGAACDPAVEPGKECAGYCIGISSGDPNNPLSMCAALCAAGGELADTTECGGLENGLCVYIPGTAGVGDSAFCTNACKEHDDCQSPDFWCRDVGLPTNGYCTDADKCPNGQGDCNKNDTAAKCTETKYGPYCINPKFPLGDAAPGGEGGGGGGGAGGSGTGGSSTGGAGGAGGA